MKINWKKLSIALFLLFVLGLFLYFAFPFIDEDPNNTVYDFSLQKEIPKQQPNYLSIGIFFVATIALLIYAVIETETESRIYVRSGNEILNDINSQRYLITMDFCPPFEIIRDQLLGDTTYGMLRYLRIKDARKKLFDFIAIANANYMNSDVNPNYHCPIIGQAPADVYHEVNKRGLTPTDRGTVTYFKSASRILKNSAPELAKEISRKATKALQEEKGEKYGIEDDD